MLAYINNLVNILKINTVKLYLVIADVLLVIFAIVFANAGLLPFKSLGDFAFFAILALVLAIYRPGWAFLFFVGSLVLENINLAPASIGISIRPYQFMALVTIIALAVGFGAKRLKFEIPKWKWYDALPIIFALAGFLSAIFSITGPIGESNLQPFKQAVIATTFVGIYFLVRIYVQTFDDLKRVAPFFLSSGVVVALYGIWQNIRFAGELNSFEVMPGRPNGTFTEADWLGIYLIFLLSAILSIIYYLNKKIRISNDQFSISNKFSIIQFFNYVLLTLAITALVLTVSRSAWLGAVIITLGFLKMVLLSNSRPENESGFKNKFFAIYKKVNWRGFFRILRNLALAIICSIAIVYVFNLTTFQLGSRAASTGGLQKITIACLGGSDKVVPEKINSLAELENYGCRHINLEDIEKELESSNAVLEVYRPDPNVGIRAKIYKTAWEQIKQNPIFGIGWGSIGSILGTDDRGASLNASNIFLETWLGAGLLGLLALVILFGYICIAAIRQWLNNEDKTVSIFILLTLVAIVIPNLFNSGIFLGFVWAYLAVAVSLLQKESQ